MGMAIGKYLATALVLGLMIWTWGLRIDAGTAQRNSELQTELENRIRDYIKAKQPTVTSVAFQQIYTEAVPVDPQAPQTQKVLVHFRYVTDEIGTDNQLLTEQTFEGSVLLRSDDGINWEWIDNQIRSPRIRFERGTLIRLRDMDPNTPPSTDPNDKPAN
jgi:hypothetical protein